jgi:hypothetical protein
LLKFNFIYSAAKVIVMFLISLTVKTASLKQIFFWNWSFINHFDNLFIFRSNWIISDDSDQISGNLSNSASYYFFRIILNLVRVFFAWIKYFYLKNFLSKSAVSFVFIKSALAFSEVKLCMKYSWSILDLIWNLELQIIWNNLN